MTKDFKIPIVKDLMRVHYNANNRNLILLGIYNIIKINWNFGNIIYQIFRNCIQFLDHYVNNMHIYKYNAIIIPHLTMLFINFNISRNPN